MGAALPFLAIAWPLLLILLIELLYLISLFIPEKITQTKIQPTISIWLSNSISRLIIKNIKNLSKVTKLSTFFGFSCLMKRREDLLFSYEANKLGFKIVFENKVRPRQANPDSLSDIGKFMRRVAPAVFDEMINMGDLTSFFTLSYSFLSIFSLPPWIYYPLIGNKTVLFSGIIFILCLMLAFFLIIVSEGFISKLHYFPLFLLSIFIYSWF